MTTAHLGALVLVFSLCLFTINTAPTEPSEDTNLVKNATENGSNTTEPLSTTVANTSVTTTTEALTAQSSDESKPEQDSEETDDDEDNSIEPLDVKPKKEPSPDYLLYKVEKGIRGLSLKDIEFILDIGKDTKVFSLALADKLGYVLDGDNSDPHVNVIKDNQEQLVSELESKREGLENFYKHTVPPTQPATTTAEDKGSLTEYTIVKMIDNLSVEEIDEVLYYEESIPSALGDALGFELDRDDSYLEYLLEQGAEKWEGILLETRERKVKYNKEHPAIPPPPQDDGSDKKLGPSGNVENGDSRDGGHPGVDNNGQHGEGSEKDHHPPPDKDQKGVEGNANVKTVKVGDGQSTIDSDAGGIGGEDDGDGNPENGDKNGSDRSSNDKEENGTENDPDRSSRENESESSPDSNGNANDGNKETSGFSLDAGDDGESDNLEETRSSFGAWHFLTIFILIGVAVVVGYVCVHNRKKLREGVATYVSDANKRRRRAREYKPLVNT